MPSLRIDIAGVAVTELARQFGTPTFVYDAAMIHRRIADLAAFDVVRYAEKACSNLAILDRVRRDGVLVDTVSAGEIRRALAAGYAPAGNPPPIVYTADVFDAESLGVVRGTEHPRQLRLARHDRAVRPPRPGREITLRINPGFGHGHSRKTNTGGKQAKHGIWHAKSPMPRPGRAISDCRVTGLHMHIGSGTDLETSLAGLRRPWKKPPRRSARTVASISAGGGLPTVIADATHPSTWRYLRPLERHPPAAARSVRARCPAGDRAGPYPVAESGYLVAEIRAVKRQDDNMFYLSTPGSTTWPGRSSTAAYHPMSLCRRTARPVAPSRTWSWAARCANRETSSRRRRRRSSPRVGCPRPESATCW